ncbi:MAG TPA: gliding motility-associated C-terminal domain-containing protein, partial [Bacteroidia bacterium]|nr:gliding motility-associated C-terminal domain-containing protein [Bacteroidia bacterium]
ATATVNTPPTITINPSSTSVCAGATVTLTAIGAGTSGSYEWDNGSTNATITDNPVTQTVYTVTGTDGTTNCSNIATQTITINPLPTIQTISATSTVVCRGAINPPVVLSVPNPGTWIGPAPSTATISANSTSISVTQGGVYSLVTTNGCGSTPSAPYPLAVDSVIAGFTASPLSGQTPVSVTYTNTSVALPGNNITTYSWSFGNGSSSTAINPSNVFTGGATYQTTLTVVDNMLCKDTATMYIVVTDVPIIVIIPNIFTPNGDNINDVFSVDVTGTNNFDCKIYDRWGLLLHEWSGANGGWDGKAKNGVNCTDGTYFYLITYVDNKNKSVVKNGFFQLIR